MQQQQEQQQELEREYIENFVRFFSLLWYCRNSKNSKEDNEHRKEEKSCL